MSDRATVLLVTDPRELDAKRAIWGTGGWLQASDREALDWLTLVRLCGLRAMVCTGDAGSLRSLSPSALTWVVLAGRHREISSELATLFRDWLERYPIAVLVRAGPADHRISGLAGAHSSGEHIRVPEVRQATEPGRRWRCRRGFRAGPLRPAPGTKAWAVAGQEPIITTRRVGKGQVVSLGFHPSEARDDDGVATCLLRDLLAESAAGPVAFLDLSGTVILRMDDPGSAQNVYNTDWSYPELSALQWREIGRILREREASVSVAYCAGWVDDGDPRRGTLTVAGRSAERSPGRIHDSPLVVYLDRAGNLPGTTHDFTGESVALAELAAEGVVSVELHGYTHMHPEPTVWATAKDRYCATHWYRELGRRALPVLSAIPPPRHPICKGIDRIQHYFRSRPTTLVCPGDEWTDEALEIALDRGISLVSSYYLALRHEGRLAWTQHVCAPYLDEPDEAWFDAGLPVIGYFHDREPSLFGAAWLGGWLDRWTAVGAKRFISFRDLAFQLSLHLEVEAQNSALRVDLHSEGDAVPAAKILLRLHHRGDVLPVSTRTHFKHRPCRSNVIAADSRTVCLEVYPALEPIA